MHKRTKNGVVAAVTGAVAAGVLATGLAATVGAGTAQTAAASTSPSVSSGASVAGMTASESFDGHGKIARHHKKASRSERTEVKKTVKKVTGLPSGKATATSFWDPETASGKPMRYETLASPYWPLGTKVRVTYNGQSAVGVVEDFGPAEWAVAQHSPPAILDLSEKMMADFTGARENSVPVHFEVLKMGSGPVYTSGGTGYDLAMGN